MWRQRPFHYHDRFTQDVKRQATDPLEHLPSFSATDARDAQHVGQPPALRGPHDVDPIPLFAEDMFPKVLETIAIHTYRRPGVSLHEKGEVLLEFVDGHVDGRAVEVAPQISVKNKLLRKTL